MHEYSKVLNQNGKLHRENKEMERMLYICKEEHGSCELHLKMISMLNAKLTKAEQKLADLREELFFAYDSSAVQMMEPQRVEDRGYSRERSPIYRYEQPPTITMPRN
jgi:hypothetical protein